MIKMADILSVDDRKALSSLSSLCNSMNSSLEESGPYQFPIDDIISKAIPLPSNIIVYGYTDEDLPAKGLYFHKGYIFTSLLMTYVIKKICTNHHDKIRFSLLKINVPVGTRCLYLSSEQILIFSYGSILKILSKLPEDIVCNIDNDRMTTISITSYNIELYKQVKHLSKFKSNVEDIINKCKGRLVDKNGVECESDYVCSPSSGKCTDISNVVLNGYGLNNFWDELEFETRSDLDQKLRHKIKSVLRYNKSFDGYINSILRTETVPMDRDKLSENLRQLNIFKDIYTIDSLMKYDPDLNGKLLYRGFDSIDLENILSETGVIVNKSFSSSSPNLEIAWKFTSQFKRKCCVIVFSVPPEIKSIDIDDIISSSIGVITPSEFDGIHFEHEILIQRNTQFVHFKKLPPVFMND